MIKVPNFELLSKIKTFLFSIQRQEWNLETEISLILISSSFPQPILIKSLSKLTTNIAFDSEDLEICSRTM